MKRSQQIHFYCSDQEQRDFVEFSIEQGCSPISGYADGPVPRVITLDELDRGKVYLCPSDLVKHIVLHPVKNETYAVDFSVSPVIEFSQSVMREKALSRGRLYVQFGYDGRDGWVAYPESLTTTHKKLLSHLKQKILTNERYLDGYISHDAESFRSQGGELVQF